MDDHTMIINFSFTYIVYTLSQIIIFKLLTVEKDNFAPFSHLQIS